MLSKAPLRAYVIGERVLAFSPKIEFAKAIEMRIYYADSDIPEARKERNFVISREGPSQRWYTEPSVQGAYASESGPGGDHDTVENYVSLYTGYWEGRRIIFSGE